MSIRLARLAAFLAAAVVALVCTSVKGQGEGDNPIFAQAKIGTVPVAANPAPEKLKPEERVRQALQQPTELHASETRLEDVMDLLKEKHKIEIQFDKKALFDAGTSTETQITKSVKGISLRSALRLILHEDDLTYVVKDDVLLITTPEVADQYMELKVYDVSDMAPAGAEAAAFFEQLTDTITDCVRPSTFDANGGPGTIRRFDAGGIRALIVSQTQAVHEEIADLLAKLREVRHPRVGEPKPDKQSGNAPPSVPIVWPKLSAAEQSIRRALAKPIAVDFQEKPLKDVAAALQEKAGVPLLLDKRALDDAGIETDAPITAKIDGLKLKSTLDLILKPVELTWTVRNDAVQITTPEVAERELCSRVYDISDFAAFRNARGEPVPDYDALISAITAAVKPETWEDKDGFRSIKPLDGQGVQTLVICHHWPVHEEIEVLLGNLRKLRKAAFTKEDIAKLPPAPPPGKKESKPQINAD